MDPSSAPHHQVCQEKKHIINYILVQLKLHSSSKIIFTDHDFTFPFHSDTCFFAILGYLVNSKKGLIFINLQVGFSFSFFLFFLWFTERGTKRKEEKDFCFFCPLFCFWPFIFYGNLIKVCINYFVL